MKKFCACFMAIILSVSIILTGCGENKETEAPTNENESISENTTEIKETAESEDTSEDLTEATESQTETETATEILTEQTEPDLEPVDYDNIVTDMFRYSEGEFFYAIPKINLEGENFSEINDEIYQIYSSGDGSGDIESYLNDIENIDNNQYPDTYKIDYSWGIKDNVLSIVIEYKSSIGGLTYYDVYNLDINDGSKISNEQVVAVSGFSADEYNEKAKQAVGSFFWNSLAYDGLFNNEWAVTSFNDSLKRSLSSEYIDRRTPYFNNNQELCIVVAYRPMAGSDTDFANLNLENFELVPDYDKEAELLPNENKLISEDEAYEIACEYYKNEYGIVSGDKAKETGYEYGIRYKEYVKENNKHLVTLDWLVDGRWSTLDYIYVNAETGECTPYLND